MTAWKWIAGIGLAAVLALLLPPTGDGSYTCDRPPVVLLVAPAEEASGQARALFFDEGHQCNEDARERGRATGGIAVLTVPLAVWVRRRGVLASSAE